MVGGLIMELRQEVVITGKEIITIKDPQINKGIVTEADRIIQGTRKAVIALFMQLQIKIVYVNNGIPSKSSKL